MDIYGSGRASGNVWRGNGLGYDVTELMWVVYAGRARVGSSECD
jgi:hypothetical protein